MARLLGQIPVTEIIRMAVEDFLIATINEHQMMKKRIKKKKNNNNNIDYETFTAFYPVVWCVCGVYVK